MVLYRVIFFVYILSLLILPQSKKVIDFSSSNLPVIVIDTHDQTILDEPKITASMGIIYNGPGNRNNITDPFNNYNGTIGIELRGNSTQNIFPKKPYSIETRDSLGENLNVSLLGMPEDNDWILLASYIDRTFTRDPLALYLSSLTGRWSSRSRFCEVVVNGEYLGIYLLTEKIKRDDNRVDIKNLTPDDTTASKISGGYIYEISGFGGDFGENRLLHYPEPEDIIDEQLAYIRSYDDGFRYLMIFPTFNDTVNGYEKLIDTESFIDEIIVQEFMRNSDAYGWSAYFHKDRNEKLKAGPVWDFDQSSGNSSYLEGEKPTGWVLGKSTWHPFFWKKLFDDEGFNNKLRIRWNELRKNKFSDENISSFIDSCAGYLDEAQERNFEKWPILGVFLWRETEGYQNRDTYQKEVDYLKNYMIERAEWMDNQLKIDPAFINSNVNKLPESFSLDQNYPNPFNPSTVIRYTISQTGHVSLKLFDVLGKEVEVLVNEIQGAGKYSLVFSNEQLPSGLYFYRLTAGNKVVTKKMILLK